MMGPGKYDDEATIVMERTKAEGVIVIIWNGKDGAGFSAQFSNPVLMMHIPEMLRNIADQIESGSDLTVARQGTNPDCQ
jgi:hypothetical protein